MTIALKPKTIDNLRFSKKFITLLRNFQKQDIFVGGQSPFQESLDPDQEIVFINNQVENCHHGYQSSLLVCFAAVFGHLAQTVKLTMSG